MADEQWFTRDYGSETGKALSMSKSVLGLFVFHLLRLGGRINSTYALNAQYDRSYVQMSIMLPAGKREELEKLSGIALEAPSVLIPA